MSLNAKGVWAVGVWAQTVWADGVWYEEATPDVPGIEYTNTDKRLHYDMPKNKLHYNIKE